MSMPASDGVHSDGVHIVLLRATQPVMDVFLHAPSSTFTCTGGGCGTHP